MDAIYVHVEEREKHAKIGGNIPPEIDDYL